MKQILSFILVSALVFSATATSNIEIISQVLSGFALGMNYSDLQPALVNCSVAWNNTNASVYNAIAASSNIESEVFELAVENLGYNFAHSVRVCAQASEIEKSLLEFVGAKLATLTPEQVSNQLFNNMFTFNLQWIKLRTQFVQQDYQGLGVTLAELVNFFAENNTQTQVIQSRRRRLSDISNLAKEQALFDLNATVLGLLGFIEEANTTIVVDDYLALVNYTTVLVNQLTALETAIQAMDFTTIIAIANQLPIIWVNCADYAVFLKNETIAFVQRDLPLFTNQTTLNKAVDALIWDLPTTLNNLHRIANATQNGDYREAGHGSGAFYNQLRNGALSL